MLQAIKRLMTALQRLCPTDPSRCMDFSVAGDEGRGIAGSGSNRDALLQAQVGAAARLTAAVRAVVRSECVCTKAVPVWWALLTESLHCCVLHGRCDAWDAHVLARDTAASMQAPVDFAMLRMQRCR